MVKAGRITDEKDCIRFYTEVLGMTLESFVGGTPPVARRRDEAPKRQPGLLRCIVCAQSTP